MGLPEPAPEQFNVGGRRVGVAARIGEDALIAFEQQPGIGLALRKACLQRRGLIAQAGVRPPAPGMPDALRAQVERHVDVVISGGV